MPAGRGTGSLDVHMKWSLQGCCCLDLEPAPLAASLLIFALPGKTNAWCWKVIHNEGWGFSLLLPLDYHKNRPGVFCTEELGMLERPSVWKMQVFLPSFLPSGIAEYEPVLEIRSTEVTGSDKWAGKIAAIFIKDFNLSLFPLSTLS